MASCSLLGVLFAQAMDRPKSAPVIIQNRGFAFIMIGQFAWKGEMDAQARRTDPVGLRPRIFPRDGLVSKETLWNAPGAAHFHDAFAGAQKAQGRAKESKRNALHAALRTEVKKGDFVPFLFPKCLTC
jgi:hypothetical protein